MFSGLSIPMNPAFNIKLLSILSIGNAASAEYNPFWDNLIRCQICTTFLNIGIFFKNYINNRSPETRLGRIGCIIYKVCMTHCQDECRSLSGGVTKNLTLHWMKKYFFLFTIINGRSVAFQPCITLGGVSWFNLAEKNVLSKKVP